MKSKSTPIYAIRYRQNVLNAVKLWVTKHGQQHKTGETDVKRTDILNTANAYITKDRADTHGDAESNFGLIAAYWSAHLDMAISASDVAVMMALLKLARSNGNPTHLDNYIDACGYIALGGEISGAGE